MKIAISILLSILCTVLMIAAFAGFIWLIANHFLLFVGLLISLAILLFIALIACKIYEWIE